MNIINKQISQMNRTELKELEKLIYTIDVKSADNQLLKLLDDTLNYTSKYPLSFNGSKYLFSQNLFNKCIEITNNLAKNYPEKIKQMSQLQKFIQKDHIKFSDVAFWNNNTLYLSCYPIVIKELIENGNSNIINSLHSIVPGMFSLLLKRLKINECSLIDNTETKIHYSTNFIEESKSSLAIYEEIFFWNNDNIIPIAIRKTRILELYDELNICVQKAIVEKGDDRLRLTDMNKINQFVSNKFLTENFQLEMDYSIPHNIIKSKVKKF